MFFLFFLYFFIFCLIYEKKVSRNPPRTMHHKMFCVEWKRSLSWISFFSLVLENNHLFLCLRNYRWEWINDKKNWGIRKGLNHGASLCTSTVDSRTTARHFFKLIYFLFHIFLKYGFLFIFHLFSCNQKNYY